MPSDSGAAQALAAAEAAAVALPYMPTTAKSVEHQTPRTLFDALDTEFGPFTCDPACRPNQYTARVIMQRGGHVIHPNSTEMDDEMLGWEFTSAIDGLMNRWEGRVFLNPPYTAKMLDAFTSKARAEVEAGNCELVVALLPANKTEQPWWQRNVMREAAYDRLAAPESLELVRWLPGRLRFEGEGQTSSATFASCVAVWRRQAPQAARAETEVGT